MGKIRSAIVRFFCRYGKYGAQLPSYHGNSEPKVPLILQK